MLGGLVESDVVKQVELGFHAERGAVGNTERAYQSFGPLGHAARVTAVRLVSLRIQNIAEQGQGRIVKKRVPEDGLGVRLEQQITFADGLESANRRSVEVDTLDKAVFVERVGREGDVLQPAEQVHEFQIDEGVLFLANLLQDVPYRYVACGHDRLVRVTAPWGRVHRSRW